MQHIHELTIYEHRHGRLCKDNENYGPALSRNFRIDTPMNKSTNYVWETLPSCLSRAPDFERVAQHFTYNVPFKIVERIMPNTPLHARSMFGSVHLGLPIEEAKQQIKEWLPVGVPIYGVKNYDNSPAGPRSWLRLYAPSDPIVRIDNQLGLELFTAMIGFIDEKRMHLIRYQEGSDYGFYWYDSSQAFRQQFEIVSALGMAVHGSRSSWTYQQL